VRLVARIFESRFNNCGTSGSVDVSAYGVCHQADRVVRIALKAKMRNRIHLYCSLVFDPIIFI